ncbi:MAG TPA: glycoside hydrolase family 30 beta sandwich domain-containing protein [Puia sp.]|nr:glycoside hydrolase family 30 beta sandwich domain-containing protein [Puia sp.]
MAFVILISSFLSLFSCSRDNNSGSGGTTPPVNNQASDVSYWLTKGDQTVLLQKQNVSLIFGSNANSNPFIDVDSTQTFQTVDGFGFTLTGGSAYVINQMDAGSRASLLKELFGNDSLSMGISYLRLSIGSSDLNASVFSYDDMPVGQSDTSLVHFSLAADSTDLIPILKQIIAISPSIKIIATPWSAPVWMKDNNNSVAGSLLTNYYSSYAQYFVKYIQQMKLNGITIDAITPQNEPLNPNNNPSMVMQAADESSFIKNYLGPAFQSAGITTKIVVYDHNCDRPDYPETVLSDASANAFVNGSAFHLYAGDISALSQVHNLYPGKQLYFTEQYTASTGDFGGDLQWHVKNVIIGSMRNWSRNALEWNLANDPSFGPHTVGGCTTCKGGLTISGSSVTRNVGYYIVAHASKFVPPGSVRISSTVTNLLQTAAFVTPDRKKVLIVENDDQSPDSFNLRFNGKWITTTVPAGSVCTYVW